MIMTNSTTNKPAAVKRPRKMAREPKSPDVGEPQPGNGPVATVPEASKPPTKIKLILDLLSRPQAATLDQMVEATGWLPHTTRAALTGLKKKGHEVTSTKADGVRTYRVIILQGEQANVPAETGTKVEA
jgi:hypothetical protein